jgi:hypothetical protein
VLPTRLLVRSADYVADGNAALGPGPLNLIEVHPELLGLLLRGLRGIRLLTALLTTGGLLRRLLALLRHLLSLLCSLSRRLLGLSRRLPGSVLSLARHLSGLIRSLARSVLHTLRGLAYLVRDPTERTSSALLLAACEAAYGVLRLLGRLARGILDLTRRLAGRLLSLTSNLTCLVCSLACGILDLTRRLAGYVLRLLRRLRYLLLGALGRLFHLVLNALLMGRLVYGPFELYVVVGHLLDLGLGIAIGELFGVLLELLTVVLDLTFQAANGLRVEVPRALLGQLFDLLL